MNRIYCFPLAVILAASGGACFTLDTDASENREQAGRQDRGRNPGDVQVGFDTDPEGGTRWAYHLQYKDVILSPDGKHLLANAPVPGPKKGYAAPGLVLVMQPLPSGEPTLFGEAINLTRINFAPDGSAAYLLHEDGQLLSKLDFATRTLSTLGSFQEAFGVLDTSPDGRYLIGTNLPTQDWLEADDSNECAATWAMGSRCAIGIFDLQTGWTTVTHRTTPLRDLDVVPATGELLVTSSVWEGNTPTATLAFVNPATGEVVKEVSFTNCADELKIVPGGKLALLAPQWCQQDPISVVDLTTRSFVENLPGFGPVVVSEDGSTAIGFTQKADMQNAWGYAQEQPYGLIVVDLVTLDWKVKEYGPSRPSYFLAKDGKTLVTHGQETTCWATSEGADECTTDYSMAVYEVASMERNEVVGPAVPLWRFVQSPDGNTLYVPWKGALVRLDIAAATTTGISTQGTPELINIRPQADFLVLGESDRPEFYLHPLTGGGNGSSGSFDLSVGKLTSGL
jgi:hypothetical protein